MSGILWLASYPRSGNTWSRLFLAACRANLTALDINRLPLGAIASDRQMIDTALGLPSAMLTADELFALLPAAFRRIAADGNGALPIKVHDAHDPRFPADASRGVIHIVRNPLDTAVSLASFASRSIDEVIDRMANEAETQSKPPGGYARQLPQHLRSWSGHAQSWIMQRGIATLRIRYEDMVLSPEPTFTAMADFAGLPCDLPRITRALAACGFAELQAQERADGFFERPSYTSRFFRRGRVGDWRDVLTPDQVRRIVARHGPMMTQLGYLAPDGEITERPPEHNVACVETLA